MTKHKVVVLGAGLVGGPMAVDLARNGEFLVTLADRDEDALARVLAKQPSVGTIVADLSDPQAVTELAGQFDLVLSAVPGYMGYGTLEAVIKAGKNVVDIAFFPEDPFGLDKLAREKNVTAVVDCGVAPGLSNLLVGHVDTVLDRMNSAVILVGGLPEIRTWPYEYKAVFSPIDVIEEYTRPARYIENGTLVTRAALSDPELVEFPGVGTLEAFNTDGLRTLAETIDAPNLKEKTLRYPGHVEKMAVLRDTGFFSSQEIDVNGKPIRPIDVTSKLLFSKWKLEKDEVDITVMRVIIEGSKSGKDLRYTYNLHDRYDPGTDTHAMARTTGYTATAVIRLLSAGLYGTPGIIPPELIAKNPACFEFIKERLGERKILCREQIEELG